MYQTLYLIFYLGILLFSVIFIIRCRDSPFSRRLTVGVAIPGLLILPYFVEIISQFLISVLSYSLFILIIITGIGLMLKSLFK